MTWLAIAIFMFVALIWWDLRDILNELKKLNKK